MNKKEYKLKVQQNRSQLREIGVKNAMYYFAIKYPKYSWKKKGDKDYNRIDNLWHGKIIDEDFLTKMNAFVHFKEVEFDN
mgnify:CR=1 FL=1|tara:strand:+ start:27872 stop:28111 length:240 start_codon:yes stop_codon:yes gene_type:complete